MREEALLHFRKDERPFVERMLGWVEHAVKASSPRHSDFLDPRQLYILQTIVNRYPDMELYADGGYEAAERKKAIVTPAFIPFEKEDIDIVLLEVKADQRFHQLTHGDYLGALLNIGLKREKFGDIIVFQHGAHMIVSGDVASFVTSQLQQVHRQPVTVELKPLDLVADNDQALEEKSFTVASLRLDAVVSDAYGMSRAKAVPLIRAGKCKVNWTVIEDPSIHIKEGDTISLMGHGRCKVIETDGVTKKGRFRLKIGRYK